MLVGMTLMFLLIVVAEGALCWFVWRRLGDHLKENPEAVAALVTHLCIPLLGKKNPPEVPPEESQQPQG